VKKSVFREEWFLWEKTTKGDVAPPDFLRVALTEGDDVRLSSRKAACSSMAPPGSTGNPGSVYTNCETAIASSGEIIAPCGPPVARQESSSSSCTFP
jgi:hypothetical protein